jgi:2,3-dimethylmalate lyase
MKSLTFRQLVHLEKPLVLPGAHDALSAILIKQAGFKAFFIGGFQTAGASYGVPDIGLLALAEFAAAYHDIIDACDLPVLVDADNCYGDVKNVVHVLHTYEKMGVQGLFFEDQVSPKNCPHIGKVQVVPTEEMERKIRVAVANRLNPDTFIMARTDARAVYGMDEMLRRAERYVHAGADGLYIESLQNVEEMERAVRTVDTAHMASIFEGINPILRPVEIAALGYKIVIYGNTLLSRSTKIMQLALADLKSGELKLFGSGTPFEEYTNIVGINRWTEIEKKFGC